MACSTTAPAPTDGSPALRPAAGRHQITNIVIKVTGNKATGQWLFTKRKIYNEGSARWQYKGGVNPAW